MASTPARPTGTRVTGTGPAGERGASERRVSAVHHLTLWVYTSAVLLLSLLPLLVLLG